MGQLENLLGLGGPCWQASIEEKFRQHSILMGEQLTGVARFLAGTVPTHSSAFTTATPLSLSKPLQKLLLLVMQMAQTM